MDAHPSPAPLLIMRLRGTQAEMGKQHGELLQSVGGWEQAMDFYPRMASAMLSLSTPARVRGPMRRAMQTSLTIAAGRLHRARRKHFPEFAARTDALLQSAGLRPSLGRALTVMDVFQNTVGLVGRMGLLTPTGLSVAAVPACTSLAVWGESSSDGVLRHARNFDFPGAGVWDMAPTVVLCDPDEGLRYGFVTTRGADVPGVTAFNEAGLSLTAHTRFHREINLDGVSVVDFGHEIVRRCRTLEEVRELASKLRTASTWGFLVSSAEEKSALLIETSGEQVRFVEPRPGDAHLAQTNRYRDPDLSAGEVTSSTSFAIDSDARFDRADAAIARCGGKLGREDLQRMLGDTGDPGAPDPEACDRLGGNCIVSALTVQSVIFEPEAARVRMSVGPAPTGLGPWTDVPYSWDGPVERVAAPETEHAHPHPRDAGELLAMRRYVAATREHLSGAPAKRVREQLELAVEAAPSEPNYRFLAGIFALLCNDLRGAAEHLDRACEREEGNYRRALSLLWLARVLAADGRMHGAAESFHKLSRLPRSAEIAALQEQGAAELVRPLSRMRVRRVVPDIFLIDAVLPGKH